MFKGAQLNYLVHEKEMLVIIRVLTKWCVNLLGVPFLVYTNHKTLENFHLQHNLSRCQAWWMEFMSQYNAKIVYVKGEDNMVADTLSHLPTYTDAEKVAMHTYAHCPSDEEDNMAASIYAPVGSACSAASHLALSGEHIKAEFNLLCTTFLISVDKDLLDQIRMGYTEDK